MAAALFAAEGEENAQEEQTNEEPEETRSVGPAAGDEEASNDAEPSREANPDESDPATHPDVPGDEGKPGPESYPSFDRSEVRGNDEAQASFGSEDDATSSHDAEAHAHNNIEETLHETEEASVPREGGSQEDGAPLYSFFVHDSNRVIAETQVLPEETYIEETQVYETQDYDETHDSSFYPNGEFSLHLPSVLA